MDLYGRIREARKGAPKYRAARRAAVRERRNPHGPRAQQDPQGPRRQVAQHARLRRAVHPGLGLPRPADRAEGRSGAGPEEAADEHGRIPPRLPRLRGEVRRDPAARLQAARRARHCGANPTRRWTSSTRRRSSARSASSSSRTWSTRARSRCTGARTAGRRWPKPKSNTSRTPRRRSTSSSRWRKRASAFEARGSARLRPALQAIRRIGVDLDDDAVDDPVEPGDRVSS